MRDALSKIGKPVQLSLYEGEGHVPTKWALDNHADAVGKIMTFLGETLRSNPLCSRGQGKRKANRKRQNVPQIVITSKFERGHLTRLENCHNH